MVRGPSASPTQERIHRAALESFARKGYAATGIRELAEAAGLSSASLYNHIGTKEDLLTRIMTDGNDRLLSAARDAVADADRPDQRLGRLVQVHVVIHAAFRLECQVIDAEFAFVEGPTRDSVLAQRDAYEDLWRGCIAEGTRQGVFSVTSVPVATLALLAMGTGVAHWFRADGPLDAFDLAGPYVDLALGAVRARRARRMLTAADVDLLDRDWFARVAGARGLIPGLV